ncbi:DsbA family protein [Propionibacteriaceae bacterium Y1685]
MSNNRKKKKPSGVGAQGPSHRVRLRQQQAIAERKKRERTIMLMIAGVVVLGLIIGGVVWGVRQIGGNPDSTTFPLEDPQPVQNGRPVTFGEADAPKTLQLFADFHCPHCVEFEERYGPTITEGIEAGQVKVEVYPMAFIDAGSQRAANGFACSAAEGYQRGFFQGLWANAQLDWSPEQQIDLVRKMGHEPSPAFTECVTNGGNAAWVASITGVAEERQVTSTPAIFIDGAPVDIGTLDDASLRQQLGL